VSLAKVPLGYLLSYVQSYSVSLYLAFLLRVAAHLSFSLSRHPIPPLHREPFGLALDGSPLYIQTA
jgi:hypothetical protein